MLLYSFFCFSPKTLIMLGHHEILQILLNYTYLYCRTSCDKLLCINSFWLPVTSWVFKFNDTKKRE